jgi:hypothetical protein
MNEFRTAGERLCGRELAKENRAGVPHFVEGQHYAAIINDDTHLTALLTWVDEFGHAVAMPCKKNGEYWVPMGSARKAGQSHSFKVVDVPTDYTFSEAQTKALEDAETRGD